MPRHHRHAEAQPEQDDLTDDDRASTSAGDRHRHRSKKPAKEIVKDLYGFPLAKLTTEQKAIRDQAAAEDERAASRGWEWAQQRPAELPPEKQLKRLMRAGVPQQYRRWLWMRVSNAADSRASKPANHYLRLVESSEFRSKSLRQIHLDLPRTFPDHPHIASEAFQGKLQRVLCAFSVHDQAVGYCQGLNNLAAMLLLVTEGAEDEAFWLLTAVVGSILYPNTYTPSLEGALVEMRTLGVLVQQKLPKLHRHMQELGLDISAAATDWFLCLFCNSMPSETCMRVWDALFNEGAKVLFRVGLAVMTMHEKELLIQDNAGDLLQTIKYCAANCHDRHHLMKIAFRGIGSLPMERINRIRQAQYQEVAATMQQREAERSGAMQPQQSS